MCFTRKEENAYRLVQLASTRASMLVMSTLGRIKELKSRNMYVFITRDLCVAEWV